MGGQIVWRWGVGTPGGEEAMGADSLSLRIRRVIAFTQAVLPNPPYRQRALIWLVIDIVGGNNIVGGSGGS